MGGWDSGQHGPTDLATVHAWLAAFASAVRAGDFAAGRLLFDADVVAFGTVERVCYGLDALEHGQWRDVWPRTRDYHLELLECGRDGELAWAGATWASLARADGRRRSGRATFVLRRSGPHGGAWRAVHSHHSFDPDPQHQR